MAVHVGADIRSEGFIPRPRLYVIDPTRDALPPAPPPHPQQALLRRRRLMRRARQAGEVAAWTAGGLGLMAVSLVGLAGLVH